MILYASTHLPASLRPLSCTRNVRIPRSVFDAPLAVHRNTPALKSTAGISPVAARILPAFCSDVMHVCPPLPPDMHWAGRLLNGDEMIRENHPYRQPEFRVAGLHREAPSNFRYLCPGNNWRCCHWRRRRSRPHLHVSSGLSLNIVFCGRCGFGSRSCSLTYFMS